MFGGMVFEFFVIVIDGDDMVLVFVVYIVCDFFDVCYDVEVVVSVLCWWCIGLKCVLFD